MTLAWAHCRFGLVVLEVALLRAELGVAGLHGGKLGFGGGGVGRTVFIPNDHVGRELIGLVGAELEEMFSPDLLANRSPAVTALGCPNGQALLPPQSLR